MTATSWPHLRFKYDHAGRPPILEAASMTLQFYKEGQGCIGHDLPPRMGKSSLIHILAIEFQAAGAPFVHALTPWNNLAHQLVKVEKIKANLDRMKCEGWDGPFCAQEMTALDSARYWERKARNNADPYTLITTTIHLAYYNSNPVTAAINLACELHGQRPVIIVDEVQLLALGQKWADTLLRFQDAGAFVVTMTGTSSRSDDACILGFMSEPASEWEQKERVVIMHRGEPYIRDEDGLLVRHVAGVRRTTQERQCITRATGITVPWDVAFQEGWMHLMSAQPQNFQVVVNGEPQSMMSVSKKVADENLGRWVRSEECCRQLARKGIEWLSLLRADRRTKHAKVLAVTASDLSEKESNAHAREMRRQLSTALDNDPILGGQDLCIEICTSVTEHGDVDAKAVEKLKRFGLTSTDPNGLTPIDILIVKGMGIVGLDVPECKILLDASTIRKGPIKRQLATRVGTVWITEDGTPAPEALIAYPGDPENLAFYNSLTAASEVGRERQSQNAQEFEDVVEVKDQSIHAPIVDGSGTNAGYQDEGGKWASGDHDLLIARIHTRWPETKALRRITLIEMYQNGAFPDTAMEAEPSATTSTKSQKRRVVNLGEELQDEKAEGQSFGAKANGLASKICSYNADPDRWRMIVRKLQKKAKQKCFVSPDEAVNRIQDPEKIRELKRALDDVFIDVLQEVG